MSNVKFHPSEKGLSLVEALLVVVIIGTVVLLLANIPNSLMLVGKSRHMSLAREIAAKQIEDKRSVSYNNIGLGSSPIGDSRLSLLPQGNGTVVVGTETSPGVWVNCDISICANGEAIKQVAVTVNWVDNNKPQTITLKTMIGEGGINQ